MVISQAQFCVNLLAEYFNPGGPINKKSQLSSDIRRPLLSAKIVEGFRRNVVGDVEIELSGIVDQKGDNLFSAECFSFDCFKESGLETTIPNVSNICMVDTGTETKYMDLNKRTENGFSCYENSFGKKQYFLRGTKDIEGAVYLADIGVVNPIFGNKLIIESNVPFFFKKKIGSLFARSSKPIPAGIRVVTIKRVSQFSLEILGSIYGQLEEEFYFPHNVLQPNRAYTFEGQKINLENLSINLLLFTNFKRFQGKSNQFIYRNVNYSSPEIENIIINSASTLINLVNTDNTVPQLGTIPKEITTYSNNQTQYNSDADRFYLKEIVSCFESDCFDELCFQGLVNKSLIKRSVSNKSLAWTTLFLVSYAVNYSQDVEPTVELILNYLLSQQDNNTRLFYEGWNQIEDSVDEELSNTYSTALEQDTSITTSTNVAIFMALLKGFELTQNFKYLALACDLHTSIEKYLLGSTGLYNQSSVIKAPTIESVSYQLQLVQILQDFKNITTIVNFFKARLVAPPIGILDSVQVGTDNVLVGTDLVNIDKVLNESDADNDNFLFTPTANDNIEDLDDIFKYNYLIYSGLINLNNVLSIDFLDVIRSKYNLIEERVINKRINSALVFSIGCIIENQSFLSFDNSKFNTLIDFYNLKFQKEAVFNNMLSTLPTDFGWFNEKALNRQSHIGAILYAQAGELAVVNTEYEYLTRLASVDNLYGILLNNKADDFGLIRANKESDTSLKSRIKSEIFKQSSNIVAFTNKLQQLNSEGIINDNYKASLATEDFEDSLFSTSWGQGYLPGPNLINTNIFTIQLSQPLETDVAKELNRIKPAGIKLQVVETFSFRVGSEIGHSTSINITNFNSRCDGIDTENNNTVTTESGDKICLEDDESTILPFTPTPPILPPLDNPSVVENTCDCESLRGYITIDTIATEVRNMRTINLIATNDGFDVNATNEVVEPCDLVIKNKVNNFALDYLQVITSNLPSNLLQGQEIPSDPLIRIDRILADNNNNNVYIFAVRNSGQPGPNQLFLYKESGPGTEVIIPSNINDNFYEVVQTDNYLVIVANTEVHIVDKSNLTITTVTGLDSQITTARVIENNNNSVYLYSTNSSNGLVYHYLWEESSPSSLTFLSTLGTPSPSTTIYFNTPSSIKRLDQRPGSMEILTVSNFGLDATIEDNLTSLGATVARYAKHINGFNYFVTISEGSPFNTVNVYQEKNGVVQFLYTDTVLKELSYLAFPATTTFNMTGELFQEGNYLLMTGSNRAYSLDTQSIQTINNFICSSDSLTLDSNYTVQAIQETSNGAIVTAVDLINGNWKRYMVNQVNKVC